MKKIHTLILMALMSSCGAIKFNADPLSGPLYFENKKAPLSDIEKKQWHLLDLIKDSIPGMSVERAYEELLKDKKGSSVIVAVIDSGVDINHPELKNVIWVNENEIPNNGIDDDENGFWPQIIFDQTIFVRKIFGRTNFRTTQIQRNLFSTNISVSIFGAGQILAKVFFLADLFSVENRFGPKDFG